MGVIARQNPEAILRLPQLHDVQSVFTEWNNLSPDAQVLIAPCGTKLGKTFGSAVWMLAEAAVNPGLYCLWLAPTTYKCRAGYNYLKKMLPDIPLFDPKDGRLEIHLGNGSFIKCLHGRDAETTVEGEAVDAFVMDEAGKQKAQLFYSLLTTITQTEGRGIITGTPRGFNWYHKEFLKAVAGDPFYHWATLMTSQSPFVTQKAVDQARRLLPPALFAQYFEARFVADSTVYGDLDSVWQKDIELHRENFWVMKDEAPRLRPVVIGYDPGKRGDPACMFATNDMGQAVGYIRLKRKQYTDQAKLLAKFTQFFKGESNAVWIDRTGVGDAVVEMVSAEMDKIAGEWSLKEVVFNNAVKQDMVTRNMMAIESGWFKCPLIPRVEHEFASLEVTVTKTGLHSYNAPEGDHDDVHWAASMSISGAYAGTIHDKTLDMIEAAMSGKLLTSEDDDEDDLIDSTDGIDEMGEWDEDELDIDLEDLT